MKIKFIGWGIGGILLVIFLGIGMVLWDHHDSPTQQVKSFDTAVKKTSPPSEPSFPHLEWHNTVLLQALQGKAESLPAFGPFAKRSIPVLLTEPYGTYRYVHTENVSIHSLGKGMYVLETDFIFEKEGRYDWRRWETIVDSTNQKIISIRLGKIQYIERVQGNANNVEAERIVKKAFQLANQNDRQYFGYLLQGSNGGKKKITDIQVVKNDLMAGNGREEVYRTTYHMTVFGKKTIQNALVYLRLYENKKWQIEEIVALGETA